mgnify:CR=1 FL=1
MKVKRKSVISGIERFRDIPANPEDWVSYTMGYKNLDEAMPYLSDEDKQFILSGITSDEWKEAFSTVEEE